MNGPSRRIWLTGASSGIGAALAEQLLLAGHRLAISARTVEPLQALAARYPEQVLVAPGDLGDSQQVRAIGQRIALHWGALDTLIINAGTCEYVEVVDFQAAMVERVLRANLLSASYCIEVALPLLRDGNEPHLVGVGSSVTYLPLPRAEAYGASKAGLRYLLEALRIDLAAAYRLVAMYGWSDLVFTHVSARIPGPEHHFLINPYGLMFDEITASSLVKIDQSCNKLSESAYPVNPAGFTIHSCVHELREDAGCVLHTHTRAGIAVSAQKGGLLPLSQQSTFVLASLAYHDYEGVALNAAEKPRLQANLGKANYLILRNHGLLTVGRTIQDAFLHMYTFENSCRIQIDAQAAGGPLNMIPQAVCDANLGIMKVATAGQGAALAWPALLRKLDRMDESYKT